MLEWPRNRTPEFSEARTSSRSLLRVIVSSPALEGEHPHGEAAHSSPKSIADVSSAALIMVKGFNPFRVRVQRFPDFGRERSDLWGEHDLSAWFSGFSDSYGN